MLAREVPALVHGAEQTARAEHASGLLFGERITDLTADDVLAVFEDVPSTGSPRAGDRSRRHWSRRSARSGHRQRRRRVKRGASCRAGGVSVNNRRVTDPQARLRREDAIGGRVFVLRKGQKQQFVVRLT